MVCKFENLGLREYGTSFRIGLGFRFGILAGEFWRSRCRVQRNHAEPSIGDYKGLAGTTCLLLRLLSAAGTLCSSKSSMNMQSRVLRSIWSRKGFGVIGFEYSASAFS